LQHKQGYRFKTIARHIGVSKNTVKRYLIKYRSSKLNLDTLLKRVEEIFKIASNGGFKLLKQEDMR
jgi:predicted transcriptional regulator